MMRRQDGVFRKSLHQFILCILVSAIVLSSVTLFDQGSKVLLYSRLVKNYDLTQVRCDECLAIQTFDGSCKCKWCYEDFDRSTMLLKKDKNEWKAFADTKGTSDSVLWALNTYRDAKKVVLLGSVPLVLTVFEVFLLVANVKILRKGEERKGKLRKIKEK